MGIKIEDVQAAVESVARNVEEVAQNLAGHQAGVAGTLAELRTVIDGVGARVAALETPAPTSTEQAPAPPGAAETAPPAPEAPAPAPGAAEAATEPSPQTDPAMLQPGETVADVAKRLGVDAAAFLAHNLAMLDREAQGRGFGSSNGGVLVFAGTLLEKLAEEAAAAVL